MSKINTLNEQINLTQSVVCVGLDLIEELLPPQYVNGREQEIDFLSFLTEVIDLTAPYAVAFKIQKAFLDQYRFGHSLLVKLIHYCKTNYPDKLVITDCKIGDVHHTLKAYTKTLFDIQKTDAIVINPYMGQEIFNMINETPNKLFFLLVRTSNPGNSLIQDLKLVNHKMVWEQILELNCKQWSVTKNCIPVLSFSTESQITSIRQRIPPDLPIFWAGYGAQNLNPPNISPLYDLMNTGLLVNSSRGILYANYKNHKTWQEAIVHNIISMQKQLQI